MFHLDTRNLDSARIGSRQGLPIAEALQQQRDATQEAVARLQARRSDPTEMLGWMDLPEATSAVETIDRYVQSVPPHVTDLLVLGIGGSALGTRAIDQALASQVPEGTGKVQRIHIIDNVDGDVLDATLRTLNPRNTLVNVISKSGTTAETMAAFLIVDAWLETDLGNDRNENIIVTTDPEAGILRPYASANGMTTFNVPPSVGGRFSVLSPVGLLPLALRGIDIRAMLQGAREVDHDLAAPMNESTTKTMAAVHVLHAQKGTSINVFMPYSSRLRMLSDWYVQLWAESLGKAVDRDGNEVHAGTTPLPGVGTTDQHAQVQLFNEGPFDKLVTFIDIESPDVEIIIPDPPEQLSELAYLARKPLHSLMRAERSATAHALAQHGRPSMTLFLPRLDAHHLGALMQSLMWQTAIVGERWNINAFDQPGVELAKVYTYALMGRAGFDDIRDELTSEGVAQSASDS